VSNQSVTYLVVAVCGAFVLLAYVALILVPAWSAYGRLWERLAAAFLSLYALLAFVAVGLVGGLALIWFWDRIFA
jgi:hypothetical protein